MLDLFERDNSFTDCLLILFYSGIIVTPLTVTYDRLTRYRILLPKSGIPR
jgi:hypothetical protein